MNSLNINIVFLSFILKTNFLLKFSIFLIVKLENLHI